MGFLVSHQKSWIRIAGMKKKKKEIKKNCWKMGNKNLYLKKNFPGVDLRRSGSLRFESHRYKTFPSIKLLRPRCSIPGLQKSSHQF